MCGENHPLPYDTGEGEKLVWRLTGYQTFWLGLGLLASYEMSRVVPAIPVANPIFRFGHYVLPLALCAVFAYARHAGTGLPLFDYLLSWVAFRRRPRRLTFRGVGNESN